MDVFHNLWNAIRASVWFYELPSWLREPAALFGAAAALILVPSLLVRWWWRGRRRGLASSDRKAARRALRQEIRECRRRGEGLGAGQGLETLGRHRAALEAYRRGGHHTAAADLLRRRGRTAKAKAVAREAGLWELVADLHEADGELAEAAVAYERAGMVNAAADCFERAGVHHEAAHCYLRADMNAKAIELLMAQAGDASADQLEIAVRAALRQQDADSGQPPDPHLAAAVRRCAQLWLEQGDAERAFRVAADGGQWPAATPIARDHLPPRAENAEACAAAGVHLVAAEIFEKLGDTRREALERAQHFQQRDEAAEAARWYETAEEWDLAAEHWAASGHSAKAAELFAKSGDYQTAAQLYAEAGDPDRQQEMMGRSPEARSEQGSSERYVLRDELGRGGMGVVYRADDLLLQRAVAYKALSREKLRGDGDAERLLSEARAAARLSHPNIVQVYDAGRDARGFFIVMELVEGKNFAELLTERELSVPGAVRVGRQICAALAHAHQRRIIHRDLKPSNLLWPPEKRVKLTDFGLARAFEAAAGHVVTRPAGTPYYMAPEQIRGEAVDPRTDLYSLGCVLYELLTRKGPFEGGGSIHHHLRTQPSDPRAWRPDIPADLAALILQCLEKEPDQRPASAKELGRALADVE
ncbi:MAG: protein kinase [Thermoanaerobaculia bacterium]